MSCYTERNQIKKIDCENWVRKLKKMVFDGNNHGKNVFYALNYVLNVRKEENGSKFQISKNDQNTIHCFLLFRVISIIFPKLLYVREISLFQSMNINQGE